MVVDLTFLGTGTSTGVPVIGCACDTCRSTDPRDSRLRASVLIRAGGTTLLVDTSPDLRAQMLTARPARIDAVLYTHAHADHTAGLDELRRFNVMQAARIPVWSTPETAGDLKRRFAYAFDHAFSFFGGKPDLDLNTFEPGSPFNVNGVEVVPVPVQHGWLPIVGFRIGGLAYVTDVKTIPEESMPLLEGADVLVLSALRKKEHVAHMNLDEALAAVEALQPRRALLTHMAHDIGLHADVAATLPANVELAVDGQEIAGIPETWR